MIASLEEFINSPEIAILLLAVLGIEAIILLIIWRMRSVGIPPFQVVCFLGAGACFASAIWAILVNSGAIPVGLFLTAAFIFHVMDLWQRWQS